MWFSNWSGTSYPNIRRVYINGIDGVTAYFDKDDEVADIYVVHDEVNMGISELVPVVRKAISEKYELPLRGPLRFKDVWDAVEADTGRAREYDDVHDEMDL